MIDHLKNYEVLRFSGTGAIYDELQGTRGYGLRKLLLNGSWIDLRTQFCTACSCKVPSLSVPCSTKRRIVRYAELDIHDEKLSCYRVCKGP